jgi:Uncharacterized conserved protein (DUF2203)
MLHNRHWTLDQATAALPLVGATVRSIREARRRLARRGFDTDFALNAESSGGAWPGRDRAAAALDIALGFERLEKLEVVVRDLERGLVDFPALLDGDEVYLCWLIDEPAIEHWHGVEAGFAGRQPLDLPRR